jgi:predicted RNA-binding Zn ribbon-like protein
MPGQLAGTQQPVGQAPGGLVTLQAFVNTLDIERAAEELSGPDELASWLSSAGLLEPDAAAAGAGLGGMTAEATNGTAEATSWTARAADGTAEATRPGPGVTQADLEVALRLREALRSVLRSHVGPGPGNAVLPGDAVLPGNAVPPGDAGQLAELRRISASLPTRLAVGADGQIGLAAAGAGVPAALARILLIAADSATLGTWSRLKVCSADDCQWAFYDRSPTRSGCWCSMRVCGSRAKSRAYRKRTASGPLAPDLPGVRASRSARTAVPGA